MIASSLVIAFIPAKYEQYHSNWALRFREGAHPGSHYAISGLRWLIYSFYADYSERL